MALKATVPEIKSDLRFAKVDLKAAAKVAKAAVKAEDRAIALVVKHTARLEKALA